MGIRKGDKVRLLKAQGSFLEGSCGKVLAIRDVKSTDTDVQALKKNDISMALGLLALVKFSSGNKVILLSDLCKA